MRLLGASMWIGFGLAALVVIVALVFFLSSSQWGSTEGQITSLSIEPINNRLSGSSNPGGSVFDYKVNLKYAYEVDGMQYSGDRIVAGVENIFSAKALADAAAAQYAIGSSVAVYFDSKNPENSSLVTAKSLKASQVAILVGFVIFVMAFVGTGIFVFQRL